MEETEINEENFSQFFRDVRNSVPERGDVIAQYSASAEFVDGGEKRQIISLLTSTENKMEATAQVMRKLLFASELDSYRIPRMMAEDILEGMTDDEVASKPYKYTLEMFFYAKPENIPKNDPHWSSISVLNLEDFLDKNDIAVDARILSEEDSKKLNSEIIDHDSLAAESRDDATGGDAVGLEVSEAK